MLLRSSSRLFFVGACVASLSLLLTTTTSCRKRQPRHPDPPAPTTSATAATAPPPAETAKPVVDDKSNAAQMSDPERKAAARAAYAEGVDLQKKKDCAGALPRFETAQRLFDAPTHLLHIAQCQAQTGRLVEAQENYSTLSHLVLPPGAPAAFKEAKEAGRAELTRLTPRVPTLRVETSPAANTLKNVVVQVNGTQMPAELVGVARPLNPGRYHVTVTAAPNRSGAGDAELKEGEAKSLEVKLSP
jgi:hypothetical protein